LAVTKFVTDLDQFVLGQSAPARITIKNDGTADSSSFDLGITYTDGLGGGQLKSTFVDGIAAGESVQISVNIAPLVAGDLTFTATADSGEVVAESNENDNALTLRATAVELPNISFGDDSLEIAQLPGETGYRIEFNYTNSGDVTITTEFRIALEWSSVLSSGSFPSDSCCDTNHGMAWGPGARVYSQPGPYNFPEAGTYTVTVTLDADNGIQESNETDNVQTTTVTLN